MTRLTSALEIQNQTTSATLAVPGTDLLLQYDSTRVSGRADDRKIEIPLFEGISEPTRQSMERIEIEIRVAGQFHTQSYPPDTDTDTHVFIWDGKDGAGRPVNGVVDAEIRIGYRYPVVYRDPSGSPTTSGGGDDSPIIVDQSRSFGQVPDADSVGRGRFERTVWETERTTLNASHNEKLGFGAGWIPNHLQSPSWRERRLQDLSFQDLVLEKFVPEAASDFDPIETDEDSIFDVLGNAEFLTFTPDGTMYVATSPFVIYAIEPDGTARHVAGQIRTGYESSGDGVPATEAKLQMRALAGGPEGALYILDDSGGVRQIGTDGIITTIAGFLSNNSGYDEAITRNDGLGRATETTLGDLMDLAVGPNGSVYFAEREIELTSDNRGTFIDKGFDLGTTDYLSGAVRRITPDGRIEPVGGAPRINFRVSRSGGSFYDPEAPEDEQWTDLDEQGVYQGNAKELFFAPRTIAVGPDSTVYVLEELWTKNPSGDERRRIAPVIRAIRPDGFVRVFAGNLSGAEASDAFPIDSEGEQATDVQLREDLHFTDIAVGTNNTLYVVDSTGEAIFAIGGDGTLDIIAGDGQDPDYDVLEDGVSARATSIEPSSRPIATAPDGSIYVETGEGFTGYNDDEDGVVQIKNGSTALLGLSAIPDPSGTTVYEFDGDRHQRTSDAILGTTRRTLEYNENGLVTAFIDNDGNRTTIERDDDGILTAITAPNGQETTFTIDSNGHLATVTFPDDRTATFEYLTGGLLERHEDPKGNATKFSYDDFGRTTSRTDPTGATTTLVRSETDNGYEVTRLSPEMREITHSIQSIESGASFETFCCGGTTSDTTITEGGKTWSISRAVGGSISLTQGPDPRFGSLVPVTEEAVITSPGGRESSTSTERSVTLADTDDSLSVTSHTDTVTVNGRTYERTYSSASASPGSTSTFEITTPESRTRSLAFEDGNLVEMSVDGINPVSFSYDAQGRLTEIRQADTDEDAITELQYDDNGYLDTLTDAVGTRTDFVRDSVGRLLSIGAHKLYYDENDNLSRLVRPNDEEHAFSYTARDQLSVYTPPEAESEAGAESITYDGDGLPTELTRPSGRTITNTYGPGGQLSSASHPDASVTYTRDDNANRVTELTRSPVGDGADQTLSISRDGQAVTELGFEGPASGTFTYSHDDNGFVTDITYPDGTTRSLTHDDDGLATEVGPFSLTRDGPDGAPTQITRGPLTITLTYDNRGRVASRSHAINDAPFYTIEYTYNNVNQIIERTETEPIVGSTRTEKFAYDVDGRLTEVTRNGSVVEAYDYDANGNRIARTVDGTTETATYLAGDRLNNHGGTTYSYDADGFVTERGTTQLSYSAAGELLTATVNETPPGETPPEETTTQISYAYDGYGRRVARTSDADTTQYLYGNPTAHSQVTVARDPDGTRTRYHYDPGGRVIAFERGGNWYYVATDQVGTPRIVVDTDGVVKRIDRDSFGVVRTDTAPDFTLHVGFAGGIPDPATGLVRFGQRDYDPAAGRWTARDPALLSGGQNNFYAYVFNDPINVVDRNGLSWECWWEGTQENYNTTVDNIDPVEMAADKIADAAGKSGPGTDASDIAQEGIDEATKQLSKGASRKTALKAAAKRMARTTGVSTALDASMKAGIGIGSAINPFREHTLGEQLGDTVYDTLHEDESRRRPDRDRRPGGGGDCGEKSPENC